MKNIAIQILLTICSMNLLFAQTPIKVGIGDKLPSSDIEMANATGKSTSMAKAMGKSGLLVMFSCNTCPYVIKNQDITRKAISYCQQHNIGVVIINSNEAKREDDDSYKEMVKYAKKQKYTVPYLVDVNSNIADVFGANHTPEVFLFNSESTLVYKGSMSDNASAPSESKIYYLHDAIDALLSNKPIEPNSTKSIGCTIKRKI